MVNRIRVVVVDDHPVVRHGIRTMLSNMGDFNVVAEAESSALALSAIESHSPDIVLLDIRMPGQDGIQLARLIKARRPEVRVVMLSIHDDFDYVARSLEAGADGFLLKRANPTELAAALRAVHRGRKIASPILVSDLISNYAELRQQKTQSEFSLSETEIKILKGISQGATYRDLARQLEMSQVTVRRRIQDIYGKLSVSDRAEAVAVAIRNGLI